MSTNAVAFARRNSRPAGGRIWKALSSLVVLGAIAGGVWYFAIRGKETHAAGAGEKGEHGPRTPEGVTVEVIRPKLGGMERVSAMAGSVLSYEMADLYANVSGYLKSQEIAVDGKTVMVDIGVHVKKGDILAVIDVPEVFAAMEQAAADVEQAEAQVAQEVAHIKTAQADQKAAEAAIVEAQADIGRFTAGKNAASKSFQRYRGLRTASAVEQDVVDQKEDAFESAVAAEKSSIAAVATAEAKLAAAKAKVDQARADWKAAQANVAVMQAKHKKAKIFAEYTKVRSPYTGVVTHRQYFNGDFIRSAADGNSRPLLTVARTDLMRIRTKISDTDVPYAVVTIDALPGLTLQGTISRFTEAEIPNERTMITEIDLPNLESSPSHGKLREGMYGLATIQLTPPSGNITIPSNCLVGMTDGNEGKVMVARGGHATQVPVKVGTDDGVRVEVLSGLTADAEVIVPNAAVADGTPIVTTTALAKAETPSH